MLAVAVFLGFFQKECRRFAFRACAFDRLIPCGELAFGVLRAAEKYSTLLAVHFLNFAFAALFRTFKTGRER